MVKDIINVDLNPQNGDLLDCPLNSDLNSCKHNISIGINECPESYHDEKYNTHYRAPQNCPLRSHNITIKMKQ